MLDCVLLVDDNPADNEFHRICIERAGICRKVVVAESATDALRYMEHVAAGDQGDQYPKPNLVFLDINMHGMDGFDFLDAYNGLDAGVKSDAVVIMLSTSLNPADMARAREYKVVRAFMNKPLSLERIDQLIAQFF